LIERAARTDAPNDVCGNVDMLKLFRAGFAVETQCRKAA